MSIHVLDHSGGEPNDADQIADLVVAKLLAHPDFIPALASQLAAAIASASPAPHEQATAATPELPAPPTAEPEPSSSELAETAASSLQSWVLCNRPDLITGDPGVWASAIVAAATPRQAQAMFEWAFTSRCPSRFWIDLSTPIAAPRAERGRYGHCAQLLGEYRASTNEDPEASAKIDAVVAGVISAVNSMRVNEFSQQPVNARKNALSVLRKHAWNDGEITSIISWGMKNRPHWRSNISAVPTAATFAKLRGDWISAGSPIESPISADQQTDIDVLANGWIYHYSQRQGLKSMKLTAATKKNLHDCLIGADGADPVPTETIKSFVRWLCQPDNTHTTYFVNGLDFPDLGKVRRGLLAMSSRSESSVAATNRNASGTVSSAVDVSEV